MIQIVLHEPEIPFNTGAIGRSCVATGSGLHLIEPLGFQLSDKYLKRAGMDYWSKLDLHRYVDYESFLALHPKLQFAGETFCGSSDTAFPLNAYQTNGAAEGTAAQDAAAPHLWFATTKAPQCYADVSFGPNDYIMFGKESAGIPEEILVQHPASCIRIPMWGDIRSLNLSNSVAIILYEALRQNRFEELNQKGHLHRLSWSEEKAGISCRVPLKQ